MSVPEVFEGVFGMSSYFVPRSRLTASRQAINKPPSITSAQVVRDVQDIFTKSELFKPWLDAEKDRRNKENSFQSKRRRDRRVLVKVGHGGTLDPHATGVLIIGVGRGTKHLQSFLACTKCYDATLLLGASTDTYDVWGKILGKAQYGNISRERVEEALGSFRGSIMQRPPIYSALRIDGKRLYEYAREGKPLPRDIQEREVKVEEVAITEWLQPDSHGMKWPCETANKEDIVLAEGLLDLPRTTEKVFNPEVDAVPLLKRKRSNPPETQPLEQSKRSRTFGNDSESGNSMVCASELSSRPLSPQSPIVEIPSDSNGPPAVRLRMTVTSGFYVRSFCHDLGKAVGSLGIMAALTRTRQGQFQLDQNVLTYEDLKEGENIWGPKVRGMLSDWQQKNP